MQSFFMNRGLLVDLALLVLTIPKPSKRQVKMGGEGGEKLVKICNPVLILLFCTILLLALGKYGVSISALCGKSVCKVLPY